MNEVDVVSSIKERTLEEDILSVLIKIKSETYDRKHMAELFLDSYILGKNPINGKTIRILNKDLSYIIWKHGNEFSCQDDLINIRKMLNYDAL